MPGLSDVSLRMSVIEDTNACRSTLAETDVSAVRVDRQKHHRYLVNEVGVTGMLFHAGSECVGHAYISSNGHIGPLAVKRIDVLRDAFTAALKMAADGPSENISAFLPGTCEGALTLAVDLGMRITFPMVLMTSPGYGDWVRTFRAIRALCDGDSILTDPGEVVRSRALSGVSRKDLAR